MSILLELPLPLRLLVAWLAVSAVASPLIGRFMAETSPCSDMEVDR